MTVTLIVLLVVLFLALLFIPFMRQIAKDKVELSQTTLPQKFETLFATINAGLMGGNGELTTFDDDPRSVNMFDENHPNMLIQFYYSTANLAITLNYKFLQKELIFKKDYPGLRNITIFQQKDIANDFVFESTSLRFISFCLPSNPFISLKSALPNSSSLCFFSASAET